MKKETKTITTNKKAFHNYTVETEYQSGIVLQGCEIKSIRNGEINISDSYCVVQNGEVWVKKMELNKQPKTIIHKFIAKFNDEGIKCSENEYMEIADSFIENIDNLMKEMSHGTYETTQEFIKKI